MSGNAITRLTLQKIKNFVVPLPEFNEQEQIALIMEKHGDSIESCRLELAKLRALKSALMSDLLTGRVRVPADIFKENP